MCTHYNINNWTYVRMAGVCPSNFKLFIGSIMVVSSDVAPLDSVRFHILLSALLAERAYASIGYNSNDDCVDMHSRRGV